MNLKKKKEREQKANKLMKNENERIKSIIESDVNALCVKYYVYEKK